MEQYKTAKLLTHDEVEELYYYTPKLNLDKINSVEDCKKILKFLCELNLRPIPKGVSYNNFEDVEEYFNT